MASEALKMNVGNNMPMHIRVIEVADFNSVVKSNL